MDERRPQLSPENKRSYLRLSVLDDKLDAHLASMTDEAHRDSLDPTLHVFSVRPLFKDSLDEANDLSTYQRYRRGIESLQGASRRLSLLPELITPKNVGLNSFTLYSSLGEEERVKIITPPLYPSQFQSLGRLPLIYEIPYPSPYVGESLRNFYAYIQSRPRQVLGEIALVSYKRPHIDISARHERVRDEALIRSLARAPLATVIDLHEARPHAKITPNDTAINSSL